MKALHQSQIDTRRFWCTEKIILVHRDSNRANYWWGSWCSLIDWDCDCNKCGREWNCRSNNLWYDCADQWGQSGPLIAPMSASLIAPMSEKLDCTNECKIGDWEEGLFSTECGCCGKLFPSEGTLKIHIDKAHPWVQEESGSSRIQPTTAVVWRLCQPSWAKIIQSSCLSKTWCSSIVSDLAFYEQPAWNFHHLRTQKWFNPTWNSICQ